MTRYPIYGSAQPEEEFPHSGDSASAENPSPADPSTTASRALQGNDLQAALQLLLERARYITGATGAALALLEGEEMVCRASAGSCAPAVGARLQVRSGLTGESITRKQLLRCDNAENDPRVNLETCRELGIASIVVMPLLARTGEVRGLFELFSDHAYAFEERDLIALERMADLTRTALDFSSKKDISVLIPLRPPDALPNDPAPENAAASPTAPESSASLQLEPPPVAALSEVPIAPVLLTETEQTSSAAPSAGPVPEAMLRVQKCSSCGFPVSEGRTLCVDCEEKQHKQAGAAELMPSEYVPSFLASAQPREESWLANHVNLLAILVLVLSILVAIVVFR